MSMITCDLIRDLIPLYADNAVSEDSRALVEEHLSGSVKVTSTCSFPYHLLAVQWVL